MNTGQQLYDLSNRLKEATTSEQQSKEEKNQKSEQENVEQPKAGEQQTKHSKEREPDQSLLEELRAIRNRMDMMEATGAQRIRDAKAADAQRILDAKAADAQRIRDAKTQSSINTGLETTISDLRSDLLSQAEDEKAKRDQLAIEHEKEVVELKHLVSSLQDNVKDLINYQVTTVGVFLSLFTGQSH